MRIAKELANGRHPGRNSGTRSLCTTGRLVSAHRHQRIPGPVKNTQGEATNRLQLA
jgi:hypothetical protein